MELVYVLALPALLMYVAHFLFISNYTGRWTVALFEQQYSSGIYRYRVLGRWAVLILTDVNAGLPFFGETTFYRVGTKFDRFSAPLYWAYFQVNLAFLLATAVIWWYGLKRRLGAGPELRNTYLALLLAALLGLSVVVPYDTMGYCFLSATFVAYHARIEVAMPTVTGLTVLGTLTRETQFLAIAYAASVIVWQGVTRAGVLKFAGITGGFGATYLGLRLVYGTTETAFRSIELVDNLTRIPKLLGLATMLALTLVVVDALPRPHEATFKAVAIPLVLMAPYLAMILLFGKVDEIRLVVPVLVVLAFFLAWVGPGEAPHGGA